MGFKQLKISAMLSQEPHGLKLEEVFSQVSENIKLLQKVDTTNIEPASFPYITKRSFLRSDLEPRIENINIIKENTNFVDEFIVCKKGGLNE